MSGEGVYTYARGPIHTGSFLNNKAEGDGKELWPDGSCYEGEFHNGKKEG